MAQFIEYFTTFWFYMGGLLTIATICIIGEHIVKDAKKALKRWLRKKLNVNNNNNVNKVDYSYLNDPDYYGD